MFKFTRFVVAALQLTIASEVLNSDLDNYEHKLRAAAVALAVEGSQAAGDAILVACMYGLGSPPDRDDFIEVISRLGGTLLRPFGTDTNMDRDELGWCRDSGCGAERKTADDLLQVSNSSSNSTF